MGWGYIWQKTKEFAAGVGNLLFETVIAGCNLIPAVPRLGHALIFDEGTRRVAKHLGYVALWDILIPQALEFVTYELVIKFCENTLIKPYCPKDLEDGEPNCDTMSLYTHGSTLLLCTLMLAKGTLKLGEGAFWLYKFRSRLLKEFHIWIIYTEAPRNLLPNAERHKICDSCSNLSFATASFSFLFTRGAISLLPFVGSYLGDYHNAQYARTTTMPLCDEHQKVNLRESPGMTLAVAGLQELTFYLIKNCLKTYIYIPDYYYEDYKDFLNNFLEDYKDFLKNFLLVCESFLGDCLLIAYIALLAHAKKPKLVDKSTRLNLDPVAAFQEIIQWLIETLMSGVKRLCNKLLSKNDTPFPWLEAFQIAKLGWYHPAADTIRAIMLPCKLQTIEGICTDPIVNKNWSDLRLGLLELLNNILAKRKDVRAQLAIAVAQTAPKPFAYLIHNVLGAQRMLVTVIIFLAVHDKKVVIALRDLKREVQKMDYLGPVTIATSESQVLFRGDDAQQIVPIKPLSSAPENQVKPSDVLAIQELPSNQGLPSRRQNHVKPSDVIATQLFFANQSLSNAPKQQVKISEVITIAPCDVINNGAINNESNTINRSSNVVSVKDYINAGGRNVRPASTLSGYTTMSSYTTMFSRKNSPGNQESTLDKAHQAG